MTKQERPASYEYCPHDVMRGLRCGPCEDERARAKMWLETWTFDPDGHRALGVCSVQVAEGVKIWIRGGEAFAMPRTMAEVTPDRVRQRVRLMSAAPALVRALLAVEWGGPEMHCAECGQPEGRQHHDACSVDAALTAAGLPTQVERDAARKEIGR